MKTKKTKPAANAPATMTLAELRDALATQNAVISSAKEKIEGINAELRSRFETRLLDSLIESDRQAGQHTFEEEGIKLTGEVKATVKWDSAALESVASTMPYEQVKRVFKIDFSVPEKVYKEASEDLRLKLNAGRTVKYSEPKITFSE